MDKQKVKETKKTRITLDLSEDGYRRLEQLEAIVDADSKAQLIRQALQLFEYVAKRTAQGCSMRIVDPSGREAELVVFAVRGSESFRENAVTN